MGLNITVASKFNPFTYDDYIKPYKENIDTYFKNYRDTENKLSDLGTQLEALDYIIESEPEDSPLKSTYGNYKKELEKAAEALASGWSQADVQNYNKLKKMFAKDISPIATQYARRQKLEDEQRKTKESKPSIYFSKRAAETSLAEMIGNPNWSYTSFVGDDITKAVQSMVSPVSTILDKIFKDGDVEGYSILKSQYGITPDDVVQYYNGENGKLKEYFDKAKETVVKSYGIDTWNDQNALNTAYQYANIGIPKAIGKLTPQLVSHKQPTDPKEGKKIELYPGDSLRFDTSINSAADTEKAKTAENYKNYTETIKGTYDNGYKSVEEIAEEAKLREKGLTPENVSSYLTYLDELSVARKEDEKAGIKYPKTGAFQMSKWDSNNTDKVKARYPEFANLEEISRNDINKYIDAKTKREEAIKRYTSSAPGAFGDTGVYGGTILEDLKKGAELEDKQSRSTYHVGSPTWDSTTKTSILSALQSDYTTIKNYNVDKEGNGIYKINPSTGETEYIKAKNVPSTLFSDTSNIVFNAAYGMMIVDSEGNYYKLKGSRLGDLAEDASKLYNSLRDFSPERVNDYQKVVNKDLPEDEKSGSLSTFGTPISNMGVDELTELRDILFEERRVIVDPKNINTVYAFVNAPGNDGKMEMWQVIFDRRGAFLGCTSLGSELGNTPLSSVYATKALNNIAYTMGNYVTNKNTSTAPRSKGANPQ